MPQAPKLYIGSQQIIFGTDVSNKIVIPVNFANTNIEYVGFLPNTDCESIQTWDGMFQGCSYLTELQLDNIDPVYATSLDQFINNCPNLSNNSLDNLLGFCARAVNVSDKELSRLGFTENQINILPSLNNYSNAVNAGWSIGGGI